MNHILLELKHIRDVVEAFFLRELGDHPHADVVKAKEELNAALISKPVDVTPELTIVPGATVLSSTTEVPVVDVPSA